MFCCRIATRSGVLFSGAFLLASSVLLTTPAFSQEGADANAPAAQQAPEAAPVISAPSAPAAPAQPQSGNDGVLMVEQDPLNVERKISRYFRDAHNLRADVVERPDLPENRFVRVTYRPDAIPAIDLVLDCLPTQLDEETGQTMRQAIAITYFHRLDDRWKTAETRLDLLELINGFHQETTLPGRFLIDRDGDVVFETYLQLPGAELPVPTELVYDAVIRATDSWDEFAPRLLERFPAP